MALTLGDNFSYQGAKPLDARLNYSTIAAMKAVADATMYNGCMAYCSETEKTYQWKSTNTVDETLGKWREFQSGGGSTVEVNPTLSSGTKIAEISIDGNTENLYAPSGSGGTSDYSNLTNKPLINNVTINGNLTSGDLGLQDAIQVTSLPAPTMELIGKAYQYMGATTQTLTHGYFYEVRYENDSYVWLRVDTQPSGSGAGVTVLSQSLIAGGTSVTFTGIPTTGNYLIDFYTSNGAGHTVIDTSISGRVALTFEAQAIDIVVYCEIKEVSV